MEETLPSAHRKRLLINVITDCGFKMRKTIGLQKMLHVTLIICVINKSLLLKTRGGMIRLYSELARQE